MNSIFEEVRKESEGVIEDVADRGDESKEDMVGCLEDEIIPHVITGNGKDGYKLEITYKEAFDTDVESEEPKELKEASPSCGKDI